MQIKISVKDYIWSYCGIFFSVGSAAIMLPFVLYYLSEDMYGLWSIFQSMVAITALFDFGFSTTFARNINYCWCGAQELKETGATFAEHNEPNYGLMTVTMKACRYVFLLLSGIALVCMAVFGTIYVLHITRELSGPEPLIAWIFYVAAIFMNLYYGYFNSFLYGVGAVTAVNRVSVLSRIVQIVMTILLLATGLGIVGTAVSYLLYGFLFRILGRWEFFRYKSIGRELRKINKKPSRQEVRAVFRIVWHNASREGIVTMANYLANQACTIIAPFFMPLATVGVYSLSVQLATVLSNVAGGLYTANQPVLQSSYISNDRDRMRQTMSLIVVSYILLYIIGFLIIITAGLPILRIIKAGSTPTVIVMSGAALYQFLLKFRNCYTSYFSCTNRILYAKAFIISSAICVVLAFVFLRFMDLGIWGLFYAQILSQTFFNVWYWPRKAHREMELSVRQMKSLGMIEIREITKIFMRKRSGK